MDNLKKLGFDDWFCNNVDNEKKSFHEIARVISVHKGSYLITKGDGEVFAELVGNLLYTASSSLDFPTTGDWVYADFYDNDSHAIIHEVMPRKTLIKRKSAGKLVDFQLIGANIDTAFIMQSVDTNFNLRRMERYLVMVNQSNVKPVILLSKCDLISQEKIEEIVNSILSIAPESTVLPFSSLNGENINSIKNSLISGNTYCLLGSSGVGKTTLLNNILGREQFETQTVREKDNKGKHTTTSRELIQLENGALILDSPGMRELGNMSIDAGLDETFFEISEVEENCKFSDCTHTIEKGCAVLAAVDAGELNKDRYTNYIKMKKESAFNEMSYSEKRKKDKDFGKMIKSVKKVKNKKNNF